MGFTITEKAVIVAYSYLGNSYSDEELVLINNAMSSITSIDCASFLDEGRQTVGTYENVQKALSCLNEKETIRKVRGVYYSPDDVVRFMVLNSFKASCGLLNATNISEFSVNSDAIAEICLKKTVFDPTCGSGAFLLTALDIKLDLLESLGCAIDLATVESVARTLYGNDVNEDSVVIAKIRIYLCLLERLGAEKACGVENILNETFSNLDFLEEADGSTKSAYSIVIGNPPYVESSKSGLNLKTNYGNIYANVIKKAAEMLEDGGVMSFIIPLSYVSTPRMRLIRQELLEILPEQFILNYADRPDCLFQGVHQKLSILIGLKTCVEKRIFTSGYQYWYRAQREEIFSNIKLVRNEYDTPEFIPKLGNELDVSIYEKIQRLRDSQTLFSLSNGNKAHVYVNMRATFWMKAFLGEQSGCEYREFGYASKSLANYAMCIFNSSIFWWYWTCVSDCWHITKKELCGFGVPRDFDTYKVSKLALALEKKLNETKVYIGTKQSEFAYKHKDCKESIGHIDDYINYLFGLTDEESEYIKKYASKYRISGGACIEKNKCN